MLKFLQPLDIPGMHSTEESHDQMMKLHPAMKLPETVRPGVLSDSFPLWQRCEDGLTEKVTEKDLNP